MLPRYAEQHCSLNSGGVEGIRPIDGRGGDRGRVPIISCYHIVGTVPRHYNEVCPLRYPSTAVNSVCDEQ